MSKPINANVNLNTNHTADANTNTNHTANANTNQQRRDAADEKEVEVSTIIDVEASTIFDFDFEYGLIKRARGSSSIIPFSNGLFPDLRSFSTNELLQAHQRPSVASASSELPQLNGLPRLIPPSEIQARGELVANTSVDIEADIRGVASGSPVASGDGGGSTSNSNSKGKNRNLKQQHHPEGPSASHPHEDPDEFHYPSYDHQEQRFEPELLNFSGSPQPPTSRTTTAPSSTKNSNSNWRKIDWVKAEKKWDTSVPLTRVEQVGEGVAGLVGRWGVFFLEVFFFFFFFFSFCFLSPLLSY